MVGIELGDKEIAIYSLYLLGGWQKRVHTEDIALKCFELAPSKFSWIKHPKYPDITPARFALESAKKEESGSLVEGESERKRNISNIGGWRLTNNGVKWIKENIYRIENILGKHKQIGTRLYDHKKLKSLLKSTAFLKFLKHRENANISHAEFAESLICTVNTDKKILNDRLALLYGSAEKLDKKQVKQYIIFCRTKFKDLLGNS